MMVLDPLRESLVLQLAVKNSLVDSDLDNVCEEVKLAPMLSVLDVFIDEERETAVEAESDSSIDTDSVGDVEKLDEPVIFPLGDCELDVRDEDAPLDTLSERDPINVFDVVW